MSEDKDDELRRADIEPYEDSDAVLANMRRSALPHNEHMQSRPQDCNKSHADHKGCEHTHRTKDINDG